MNRVMLTGPTGSIGIALIEYCITHNTEVYAVCRKNSKRIDRIPSHPLVHVLECNLDELADMDISHIPECQVFYHFGWGATIGEDRNNTELQLKNIEYTLDAVALADRLGCEAFVGAGSQAEYGRFEGALNAAVPTFPENGYGIAKLCAGQLSRLECNKRGIRHVWTRILSVYGPYDSDMTMITTTIRKLLDGEVPALTKGEQKWDYLYSADAAKAMYLLGEKGKNNKIYCIGSGQARPLADYIRLLRDAVNPEAELGLGQVPYGEKQVMYLCADIDDLKEDTGFEPETTFEEGIAQTIAWMKTRDRK